MLHEENEWTLRRRDWVVEVIKSMYYQDGAEVRGRLALKSGWLAEC